MSIKIAINGFGRIGRTFLRLALERPEIEVAAINDLGDLDNLAYLLKYDTTYGKLGKEVGVEKGEKNYLVAGGKKILFLQEKDPAKLPWRDLGIDVAIESTGVFEKFEDAQKHIDVGAKRAVISAPGKGDGEGKVGKTVLLGINEDDFKKFKLTSNGSCTTNAVAPAMAVLCEKIGVKKAVLNTCHALTASQRIVDGPDTKDWRRGRAGGYNIVPSTTGAAISVSRVIEDINGKFDGLALRVPLITVSIADITFVSSKKTSVEEINDIFRKASEESRWQGILGVSDEPLVSSDLKGDTRSAIVDLTLTKVIDGDLVKVLVWYDNEWGYSWTLVEHVIRCNR